MKLSIWTYIFVTCTASLFGEAGSREPLDVNLDPHAVAADEQIPLVSYADSIEKASPSVVSVYTARFTSRQRSSVPPALQEFLRQYYGQPLENSSSGESTQKQPLGVGSGVILSESGYIITNNHVIRDPRGTPADEIRVQLSNGREYLAELVGTDPKTDVAVLKIEASEKLVPVTVADSDLLRVGDIVFAIGSPLGHSQTVTQGIVSALERTSLDILGRGSYENFIQTDAAINMGNSGGALVDALGRFVGVNTAIVSGSGGNIGLGFAIPSNMALNIAKSLVEIGEVPRGLLGLIPQDVTADIAESFGLDSTYGALVGEVQRGSPAELAGIVRGDIILEVAGVAIDSAAQLRLTVSQMMPGREVNVLIFRGGERITLPVVLGSLTGKFFGENGKNVLEGVRLKALDASMRSTLELPNTQAGVLVTDVDGASPFSDVLRAGMIVVEVNDVEVSTEAEVLEALNNGVNRVYALYEKQWRYLVLRVEK